MSTQNKANNELDDLFRKSLEEPNIPFDPEAWKAMEKKLDKFHSDRAAYWKCFFGLLALLLVTTALVVWHQTSRKTALHLAGIEQPIQSNKPANENDYSQVKKNNQEKKNSQEKNTAQVVQKHKPSNASAEKTATETQDLGKRKPLLITDTEDKVEDKISQVTHDNLKQKKETDVTEGLNRVEEQKKSAVGKGKVQGSQLLLENKSKEAPVKMETVLRKNSSKATKLKRAFDGDTALKEMNHKGKLKKRTQPKLSFLAEKKVQTEQSLNTKTTPYKSKKANEDNFIKIKEKSSQPVSYSLKNKGKKSLKPTESKYFITDPLATRLYKLVPATVSIPELPFNLLSAQQQPMPVAQLADSVPILAKRRKSPSKSLSINLIFAPDLSTVGFNHFTKPGINLGLAIEYGFSKRLSIQVGALYATKTYYAGGKDYTPPKSWPGYGPPDQVKGDCKVIDLPINMRYNFWKREQYNVFVSAGISSYLMQKEQYNYLYNGYPAIPWTVPTRNKHWLSVANFSVGYEFKLRSPLSLQIEPFVKIPLAGVGAGKVKLATTGAFFTLKYNLNK
ncbi:MAG: outer membrane beta-barrel protein [Bacteroidota bacterium]